MTLIVGNGLSYRDVEELLAERGIRVDHVTVYRWVQTFTTGQVVCGRDLRQDRRSLDLPVPGD